MSMILDALSKAERERRNGIGADVDPSRYIDHSTTKDDGIRRWLLIALVANICLLSMFAAFYFWQNHWQGSSANVENSQTITPESANEVVEDIAQQDQSPVDRSQTVEPSPPPAVTPAQIEAKPSVALQQEAVVKPQSNVKISKEEAIGASSHTKPNVNYASEPLAAKVNQPSVPIEAKNFTEPFLSANDLSASQRTQLSQYEVNVHVYDSQPAERFVLVNMVKFKEGDRLPGGGPTIAEITPEGLIMEYSQGKVLVKRH